LYPAFVSLMTRRARVALLSHLYHFTGTLKVCIPSVLFWGMNNLRCGQVIYKIIFLFAVMLKVHWQLEFKFIQNVWVQTIGIKRCSN